LILVGQLLDQKPLLAVTGKTADSNEIANDCIVFASAKGGRLVPDIEDVQDAKPVDQQILAHLPNTLRRNLTERTVKVAVPPNVVTSPNDGQYIELRLARSSNWSKSVPPSTNLLNYRTCP